MQEKKTGNGDERWAQDIKLDIKLYKWYEVQLHLPFRCAVGWLRLEWGICSEETLRFSPDCVSRIPERVDTVKGSKVSIGVCRYIPGEVYGICSNSLFPKMIY